MTRRWTHLVRRFFGSISNTDARESDLERARSILSGREWTLWMRLAPRDRRHSIEVWRRFLSNLPDATEAEQRAALLHDLGKSLAPLGPLGRVWATIGLPGTRKMKIYRDHEARGVELLAGVSDQRTLEVLRMQTDDPAARALRAADDI